MSISENPAPRALLDAAFADMYEHESLCVLRFLRTMTAGDAEAEDLCGDVFFNAWRGWHRFRGEPHAARAWLFRIARNAAVDSHRQKRRGRLVPLDQPGLSLLANDDSTAERLSIRRGLDRLKSGDREVLAMRAAGLSYEEIAAVRGGRADAARVAWHRAARRLHELLEAE